MMHVSLRQLRTFEAVARLRSFSRAAEELHVTQPTVSKQIRLLSDEIGLALLEQIGKKVFLTEAGEHLYATCGDWLETWSRFEQTIADMKGVKKGRLRIASVTTTKYFMPRLLGPFCAQYPGIDIALEVINRDRLLERLARNQDDIYVMGVPPDGMNIECEPVLENSLVVAHFSDRGRLFQSDRGRRFSAIVDARGVRASDGLDCISNVHDQPETVLAKRLVRGFFAGLSTAADGACDGPAAAVDKACSAQRWRRFWGVIDLYPSRAAMGL